MADLTITVANIHVMQSSGNISIEQAGEAGITPMMPLYSSGGKWLKAVATSAAAANVGALSLGYAGLNEYLVILKPAGKTSQVEVGATLTVGTKYVVSAAAAGGIAPSTDLTTGNFIGELGTASTAAILDLSFLVLGVTHP